MSHEAHLILCDDGLNAWESRSCEHLVIRNSILPADPEDVAQFALMEALKSSNVAPVKGGTFAAVEQGGDN